MESFPLPMLAFVGAPSVDGATYAAAVADADRADRSGDADASRAALACIWTLEACFDAADHVGRIARRLDDAARAARAARAEFGARTAAALAVIHRMSWNDATATAHDAASAARTASALAARAGRRAARADAARDARADAHGPACRSFALATAGRRGH